MIDYTKALELRSKFMPIRKIARQLGCSHEAVRENFKKRGVYVPLSVERKQFALDNSQTMTAKEIAKKLNIHLGTVYAYLRGTRHALKAGTQASTSMAYREKVSKLLDSHGIKNTLMPYKNRYAILLENGLRVAVLYRNHPDRPQKDLFLFSIGKKKWGNNYADFFILVAGSIENIYVVPNDELAENCSGVSIPVHRTRNDNKLLIWTSKYRQYLNRFDLLKETKAGIA